MARILLIEDNDLLRSMLNAALAPEGHEVHEAPDGGEGLRLFQRFEFDLVITDIIMPGRWGIETIVALKKARPKVKILAISGAGRSGAESKGRSEDLLKAAWNVGANAVLTKPFTVKHFRETLRELLGIKPETEPKPGA